MKKNCIFNPKKQCNNCGECEICDLNSKKKCNNCGKCLEMEGYDLKAIKIDEILEDDAELEDENVETKGAELSPEDPIWEFIDDIKEAKDLLENDKEESKIHEVFPGLYTLDKEFKHTNNDENDENEE